MGHEAATVDAVMPQVIVTSTAIPETNPEVLRARELGIPRSGRAQRCSRTLSLDDALTVAVAGTHGKTTTSSMVATMLDKHRPRPVLPHRRRSLRATTPTRTERRRSQLLRLPRRTSPTAPSSTSTPTVVVVTNIEADHLDHYGTLENIEKTFCKFMDLVGEKGTVIINGDNPHYVELARSTGRHVVTYGFDESCDYVCRPEDTHHKIESNFEREPPRRTARST